MAGCAQNRIQFLCLLEQGHFAAHIVHRGKINLIIRQDARKIVSRTRIDTAPHGPAINDTLCASNLTVCRLIHAADNYAEDNNAEEIVLFYVILVWEHGVFCILLLLAFVISYP
jgi:hypothetical protein